MNKKSIIISLGDNTISESAIRILKYLFDFDDQKNNKFFSGGTDQINIALQDQDDSIIGALCKMRYLAIIKNNNHYSFDFFEEGLGLEDIDIELNLNTILRMIMADSECSSPIIKLVSTFNDNGDHIGDELTKLSKYDSDIESCDSLKQANNLKMLLAS